MGWNDAPEKMKDDFGIIKANALECAVQYARIDFGKQPGFENTPFFRYELTVTSEEFNGRKLWGSFNLTDEKKLSKVKSLFFTLFGIDLKSQEDLENNLAKFVEPTYVVKAWGWKPEGQEDSIQQHQIKGIKTASTSSTNKVAF